MPMKKIIYTLLLAFTCLVALQSFNIEQLLQREGTEPGHTGSPGDSLKTCTVCHGGVTRYEHGWITSNIPASGYVPGQEYTIRAVNHSPGYDRFGFQISPQDEYGNLLGTLVVTDSIKTKLVGDNKYVTYRSGGVLSRDSMVWTFNWIAPADTVNVVVFYGAFNSNHAGHKFSDYTTLSTLRVYKEGVTGIQSKLASLQAKLYPNPVGKHLFIQLNKQNVNRAIIEVCALDGKVILTNETSFTHTQHYILEVESLKRGIYWLRIKTDDEVWVQKFVKL